MTSSEDLKEEQRRQWGESAANYDRRHESLDQDLGPVFDWMCSQAKLTGGMRVLDLACGSGLPALRVASLVGPSGKVIATDLVPTMVEITARRARELGLGNVEARVMDAEAIEFPDESFDVVSCSLGLMFCPRPEVAAAEVCRVLRKGGRFVASVWSEPDRSPGQIGPAQPVVVETLRRLGHPPSVVNYDKPGQFQLAPAGKLESLLTNAGFKQVYLEPVTLIREYESVPRFVEQVRHGPLKTVLDGSGDEEAQLVMTVLAEVLAPYTEEGVIRLPLTPLCALGVK